jgi:RNA polymerase-binding transcription factor DksA
MRQHPPDSSAAHILPQWSWRYRRLQSLRDRLLQSRAVQIAEVFEPLEHHSMNTAYNATAEFNHDMALSLLSHEDDELFEINAAIHRIPNGAYDICEETGKLIPAARLHAVPRTRYTREVEQHLKEEGFVNQTHLGAVTSIQGLETDGLSELAAEPMPLALVRHHKLSDIESAVKDPGRWTINHLTYSI